MPQVDVRMEVNEYTTPAPTLLDPQCITSLEEARAAIETYNTLQQDLHRALVQREQCINSMAAAIAPVVLAHVRHDARGVVEALQNYVRQHVNVYGQEVGAATH